MPHSIGYISVHINSVMIMNQIILKL
uniref:Uncharacterized protein n=1 Tax=Arundo donax TaxID=35708 RepID=A0A0A9BW68_ARUDO